MCVSCFTSADVRSEIAETAGITCIYLSFVLKCNTQITDIFLFIFEPSLRQSVDVCDPHFPAKLNKI